MQPTTPGFFSTWLALSASVALGCGSANATSPQNPDLNDDSHRGSKAEVLEGGPNYLANCAKCHGPTGAGTSEAPRLVGKGALPLKPPPTAVLRKSDFVTVKDVFDFTKANMPKDKPGSLSDDQYYEILAFALKANKVDLQGKKVDPTTAPTIVLPHRD